MAGFPLGQQQQQQTFTSTAQQQQVLPQQQQQMGKPTFAQQSSANTMTLKTSTPAASIAPSSTSSQALPLSQLLLSSSSAPVILVPTSNVTTTTQGYSIGAVTQKANVNTQTLVVQPLQQAGTAAEKGPVPIQPKTAQGHRLPVQLPPRHPPHILPAPPSNSQHSSPHIPVQLVGARQGLNAHAVALAQARGSMAQEGTAGGNVNGVSNNGATVRSIDERPHLETLTLFGRGGRTATVNCNGSFPPGPPMQHQIKPAIGSLKRKSDCDAPNETATDSPDCAPMKDSAPPLSPAPTKNSGMSITPPLSFERTID